MQFEAAKDFILDKLRVGLSPVLTYHSLDHIMDVYQSAEQLAHMEGIEGEDLQLLLSAVLFHDSGFLLHQKDHEQLGCELVREHLPSYGYDHQQIERICGMVMATKIPQTPLNKLEMIICDADLDYLGRDDFFTIGNKLFEEMRTCGTINTENDWNHLQVRFLESHQYFTESAIRLRKAQKAEHLELIRSKVSK